MATLATLRVNLLADTAKFEARMRKAEKRVQQFSQRATQAGGCSQRALPLLSQRSQVAFFFLPKAQQMWETAFPRCLREREQCASSR